MKLCLVFPKGRENGIRGAYFGYDGVTISVDVEGTRYVFPLSSVEYFMVWDGSEESE